MFSRILQVVSVGCLCLFRAVSGYADGVESISVSTSPAQIQQILASFQEHGLPWGGPRSGPSARAGARVAIVSEDLRNGGVLGVTLGIREAAEVIGWSTRVYDAGGTPDGRGKAIEAASASRPDGMIIVGADVHSLSTRLAGLAQRGIAMVGWHVAPTAGVIADGPVAINVSTDPLEVARITALAAIAEARDPAGVVILTDSNFEIAMAKANAMAAIVRACATCTLLEIRDVAISRAADAMPEVTRELLTGYGMRWTHALAINDIYFDYAVPELIKAGRPSGSISLLSAGDGSPAAFLRIRAGTFQTATVAEPLNLQGWQLVDELNRLMAGEAVTGYVIPVHLVTAGNIAFDGGPRMSYDPDNGYRDIYRQIWKR
ncbi:substrate-binding domain-containing protein [Methylomonas sp. LL1]|uniref:substrate-binding domain-containing protein n=1 Tax=Methylomonas sp. LL1 TaxID=2785785 RepID=UPI0018C43462|nr:substrate-binding domain-containing protein [Methylomonas sp. LL1]QPK61728.1 substrate-binding domain-containing protein [Methylomonas sp. LL1]